jgi:hypothetical protein
MQNKIILRRHIITLTPDALLMFVSFVFVLEAILSSGRKDPVLQDVSEGAAIFFVIIAFLDMVKWLGFRVEIADGCIRVTKFWIFRDRFCRIGQEVKVRSKQKGWDERLNMGTLVIYQPGGKVFTLDNLGRFDLVADITGQHLLSGASAR